jgi:Tfp pilus assembly protein PilF
MVARKLLLVGWDSADWKIASPLIDRGDLPHLESLVARGVMGNLTSLEPSTSPSLWTSLVTGKRPAGHGVLGFAEINADASASRPVTAASRTSPAIWNILSDQGIASHVVGWPATQYDQISRGVVASDWFPVPTAGPGQQWPPAPAGTISPQRLESVLNELRVSPEEVDEDMVRLFVPLAAEVNQNADFRLHHLRVYLASAFSIQAAATWLMENEPWEFMAICFSTLGAICRAFMPFHPPKMATISDRDFHLYADVINSAYRVHDLMLGRLVALASKDATIVVVSQHGFQNDHLRPSPQPSHLGNLQAWTRPQGMLVAAGPGLLQDELIHGASLLDIAPTLLAMYHAPLPTELPGKVLLQAFASPDKSAEPIAHENSTWSNSLSPPNFDVAQGRVALRHVHAVDYVGPFADGHLESPLNVALENKWNLARDFMAAGKPREALPLLEDLYRQWPERIEFGKQLCDCQSELGSTEAARQTLDATLEYVENDLAKLLVRATFAHRQGQYAEALQYLEEAGSRGAADLSFQRQLALTLLALRRWRDVENVCRGVIAIDPDQALAHAGLAESLLRQRRYKAASEAALTATGLNFELAPAHFVLGNALWRLGEIDAAAQALQQAARLSPRTALYHRMLALLYRDCGEQNLAANHMALSHRLIAQRKASRQREHS